MNSGFYYVRVSANTFINELMDFMKSENGQKIKYKSSSINPFMEGTLLLLY